jgi:hypothetical protein
MIVFNGLFDTARDYTFQFTVANTLVSTVSSSLAVARWLLPTADIHLPLGSELSPASATSISQRLNVSSSQ